ncbi:hypothetical protein F7Q92_19875 [Ideonella dechloratans]|uniref:Uncharacterized protein n=1 Tax=Ideonella dechloratans TaxID=36863 RepID=A0A643F964_IDEDE|nr:hypothetical protein [Ideonella dechloratans]KAB0574148.1 hypothetical protein F7Q92_19875 [Ideonella dechloratans]UFU10615.1 hypothetical protein LRM40_02595 [Ideonella dechloratans]
MVIGIGASSLVSLPARPVGPENLAVQVRDYRTEPPQATAPLDLASALASAVAGLSLRSATVAQVVVADGLARHWVVDPPAGLQSLAELQAVARARAEQMFGPMFGPMSGWVMEADWQLGRPFLCCALPAWLIDGVHMGLGRSVPVETALSTLLSGLRRATAVSGEVVWEGFWTPGLFTWVAWQAGRLRWLHSIRLTETPQGGEPLLTDVLEQACLNLQGDSVRAGLDVQAPVGVLALHPGLARLPGFQSLVLGERTCVVSQPPAWSALFDALKLTAAPPQQDAWVAALLPLAQVQRMAGLTGGANLAQPTSKAPT